MSTPQKGERRAARPGAPNSDNDHPKRGYSAATTPTLTRSAVDEARRELLFEFDCGRGQTVVVRCKRFEPGAEPRFEVLRLVSQDTHEGILAAARRLIVQADAAQNVARWNAAIERANGPSGWNGSTGWARRWSA